MHDITRRRALFSVVVLCLLLTLFCPPAAEALRGGFAPLNPAFVDYRNAREKGETLRTTTISEDAGAKIFKRGVTPGPIDLSYLKGAKIDRSFSDATARRSLSAAAIPSKFDLVAEGRVTPVVSQGGWGTCWAFATMESVESALLSSTKKTYDLSELNLAWFMYSDESSTKPAYTPWIDPASTKQNPIFDNGGSQSLEQPTALFSRGTGPLYDSDAPYPGVDDKSVNWETWVPNPLPYGPARFRLKQALRFTDTNDVKNAVMEIGGLSIAFNVNNAFRDDTTGTFFTPTVADINPKGGHAVMLVGWDDAYPKENFKNAAGVQPKADGAWKIQNSWGTDLGDKGYYWISYEDVTVLQDGGAVAFIMEPVENYDGIYFHDPLGSCLTWGFPAMTELVAANVFVSTRNEKIVEVSFMTGNANMTYAIRILKNLDADHNPGTGKAALAAPQTGRVGATGYHSVRLDEPVSIAKGERFAVEIRLGLTATSAPSDRLVLPVEVAVEKYSDKATVHPGESWVFDDEGGWEDAYYIDVPDPDDEDEDDDWLPFNLCIKAFTVAEKRSGSDDSGGGCTAGGIGLFGLVLTAGLLYRRRSK